MSPTNLEKSPQPSLQGPRLEIAGSFLIAGLRRHYTEDRISKIGAKWQQFLGCLGRNYTRVGRSTYSATRTVSIRELRPGKSNCGYRSNLEVAPTQTKENFMQKITPFLWFNGDAEEAANFYTSIFKHSKVGNIARYGEAGP